MPENDAVTDPGAEPADTPSLELPSLFGRRKKRSKKTAPAEPPVVQDEPPVVQDEPPVVQDDPPVVQDEPPVVQDEPPVVQDEPPAAAVEAEPASPVVEDEPTTVVPVVDSAPPDETAVIPDVQEEPAPEVAEPPVVADESPTEPAAEVAERPLVAEEPATGAPVHDEREVEDDERVAPTRRTPRLPALAASTASVAVGAVVGLLGCALTLVGLKTCELITGADSCGGPGLLLLIVIVVLMVLAGAALLRLFTVEDATNLSFLGVGITVAVVLMFLLDYLYEPWMFLVMPVLTALAFLLARWITTRYVEDVLADDDHEVHDIR